MAVYYLRSPFLPFWVIGLTLLQGIIYEIKIINLKLISLSQVKNLMKYFSLKLSLAISLSLFVNVLVAQNKNNDLIKNEWAVNPLSVDGNLKDWGDSLKYFNESTQFSFDIRNNNDFLYVAIISKNKQNLNRILARGITFSVNTEDRKKNGATVVFPVIDRLNLTPGSGKEKAPATQPDQQFQEQIISKITKINVSGFPDIIDGPVSLKNSYGISAAAAFNGQDNFVIEFAIPFSQLGISPVAGQQIACLFQLNGVKQPRTTYDPNRNSRGGMYGYPSRDYGYDRRPVVNRQNLTAGFWVKSILTTRINN